MKLNVIARGEQGPTVIFLHGLLGRARNLGFLQRSAATRFRTYAFDLRAHGESGHGPIDYPTMVQDVQDTMDALGVDSATLVGHSMGGKVAMLTALTAPTRVQKLLVADMAPTRTHQGHAALIATLRAMTFPPSLTRPQALELLLPVAGSQPVAELLLQNLRLGEHPGWAIGIDDIARAIDVIEDWPTIDAHPWPGEALFLRGGASSYVRPEHHDGIRALFPNARIETLEGAGHWLHTEYPKPFTEIMMNFL